MIPVTKTYLPPFEEYTATLKRAWDKGWITNNGDLVQELEAKLKEYLGVKHLFFCSNGTVVLDMALKALNITKEVITTPFSYVATANAILWRNCTPVFVDIDPVTLCIDPEKIGAAITPDTQAILATHVFGAACQVDQIKEIATLNGLKVIYDGAHAFGSMHNGASVLSFGDISTCSFHATKIFHTVEGGCIICEDDELAQSLMLYRQFGHVYDDYYDVGINAKNSEFHAAMGLCVLEKLPNLLNLRKDKFHLYNRLINFTTLSQPPLEKTDRYNYSYYPVIFESESVLLNITHELNKAGIYPRRYFFPSLNRLPFMPVSYSCPISESIASRIMCLPFYHDLEPDVIETICTTINRMVRS